MKKGRFEAFSDGVLAIIITIMVLQLQLPKGDGIEALAELWKPIVAYLLSFLFVAVYWVNHYRLFHDVEYISKPVMFCNIAWLFAVSFVPFTTAWVGDHPQSYVPMCLYFSNLFLVCLTFYFMLFFIRKENGENTKPNVRIVVSLAVYLLSATLGFFFPPAAYIAVFGISCWWFAAMKKR
ncbi:MAG: TMEM175 family protein, partial [Clostridiales bacterium]|nr:TMEM175 family protein [Clostridiales bacterium]